MYDEAIKVLLGKLGSATDAGDDLKVSEAILRLTQAKLNSRESQG